MMTTEMTSDRQRLEALQEALRVWPGFHTVLKQECGRPVSLVVRNLQVPMRSDVFSVVSGQFVNVLGRRFGPVEDCSKVAFVIVWAMRDEGS